MLQHRKILIDKAEISNKIMYIEPAAVTIECSDGNITPVFTCCISLKHFLIDPKEVKPGMMLETWDIKNVFSGNLVTQLNYTDTVSQPMSAVELKNLRIFGKTEYRKNFDGFPQEHQSPVVALKDYQRLAEIFSDAPQVISRLNPIIEFLKQCAVIYEEIALFNKSATTRELAIKSLDEVEPSFAPRITKIFNAVLRDYKSAKRFGD